MATCLVATTLVAVEVAARTGASVLRIVRPDDFRALKAFHQENNSSSEVRHQLHESLATVHPAKETEPVLATEWIFLDDGLTCRVKLRDWCRSHVSGPPGGDRRLRQALRNAPASVYQGPFQRDPDPAAGASRRTMLPEGDAPLPVSPSSGCRFRMRC